MAATTTPTLSDLLGEQLFATGGDDGVISAADAIAATVTQEDFDALLARLDSDEVRLQCPNGPLELYLQWASAEPGSDRQRRLEALIERVDMWQDRLRTPPRPDQLLQLGTALRDAIGRGDDSPFASSLEFPKDAPVDWAPGEAGALQLLAATMLFNGWWEPPLDGLTAEQVGEAALLASTLRAGAATLPMIAHGYTYPGVADLADGAVRTEILEQVAMPLPCLDKLLSERENLRWDWLDQAFEHNPIPDDGLARMPLLRAQFLSERPAATDEDGAWTAAGLDSDQAYPMLIPGLLGVMIERAQASKRLDVLAQWLDSALYWFEHPPLRAHLATLPLDDEQLREKSLWEIFGAIKQAG